MTIKYERRTRLMTQADLAKASGVSKGTISRIECGKVEEASVGTVLLLLKALGIKPSIFFANYD